ncbi:MAG: hypothetical protein IPI39_25105 [Candidatus Obscuribacter sp.]|nr:hypothetical protein [Candidatus Obscuribacter sp.]
MSVTPRSGGHCHCYERTQPIKFAKARDGIGQQASSPGGSHIPGSIPSTLFDGKVNKAQRRHLIVTGSQA